MTSPQPEQTKKPFNVWKWVGIGCGGTLVLGIILIGALIYAVQQFFNISFDAQKAEEVTKSIVDYEIPGGSRGLFTFNVNGIKAGVVTAENPEDAMLMVFQLPVDTDINAEELEKSVEQSRQSSNTGQFEVKSEREEEKELCGQNINVTVSEGEINNGVNKRNAIAYEARLVHNKKPIFIMIQTSGADAEGKASKVFNSLQCKS